MQLKYKIKLDESVDINLCNRDQCCIDDAIVKWNIEKNKLTSFYVILSDIKIQLSERKTLHYGLYSNERNHVLDIANYIISRIFIETFQTLTFKDNIQPEEYIPETPEEESQLREILRTSSSSITGSYKIYKEFDPSKVSTFDFNHKDILLYYTDGLKVDHKQSKYILFYQVLEYIQSKKRKNETKEEKKKRKDEVKRRNNEKKKESNIKEFDIIISEILSKYDTTYSIDKISEIRNRRDTCAHVYSGYKHNIDCKDVQKAAKLIIDNLHTIINSL